MGSIRGATPWTKTGYLPTAAVADRDLWENSSIYVFPPAIGTQMEVISTGGGAGNDVAAGTGVQQVVIYYLDTSYALQSEIVTMTGGVAAPTAAANILRVDNFRAYRCGATNPKAAAGTILLRGIGGGATYSIITAGYTRSRTGIYTVPAGKQLAISSVLFSTGSSAGGYAIRFTLRATYDNASSRVLGANFFMAYSEQQIQDGAIRIALDEPLVLPATVDVKVSASSDGAGGVCAAQLRGVLQTVGQI